MPCWWASWNIEPVSLLVTVHQIVDLTRAYVLGNMDVAFDNLRRAVERCDQLNYDEPWGWMHPPRHALGALLLEQVELILLLSIDKCVLDNAWR